LNLQPQVRNLASIAIHLSQWGGPGGQAPRNILAIGYGNELRSDDGLGPKVVSEIDHWRLPGLCALTCHQLTPELADPISAADEVIFFDAAVTASNEVQVRPLQPAASARILAHLSNPSVVLALARDVFGRSPPGWWITVPALDFSFGDKLSAGGKTNMTAALEAFRRLWAELNQPRG
jgi:hydrogenase maturation protease